MEVPIFRPSICVLTRLCNFAQPLFWSETLCEIALTLPPSQGCANLRTLSAFSFAGGGSQQAGNGCSAYIVPTRVCKFAHHLYYNAYLSAKDVWNFGGSRANRARDCSQEFCCPAPCGFVVPSACRGVNYAFFDWELMCAINQLRCASNASQPFFDPSHRMFTVVGTTLKSHESLLFKLRP
jgi:hypothetical protein